jgi:hypothetical protein
LDAANFGNLQDFQEEDFEQQLEGNDGMAGASSSHPPPFDSPSPTNLQNVVESEDEDDDDE